MANLSEEQKKELERRELLKMKQGIIEESEMIPQDGYVEIPKLTGWAAVSNFMYHYKWIVLVGVFVAFFLGVVLWQTFSREKEDLYVLAISTTNRSGIYVKQTDIETALERYCPDFDGNGYVHVGVNVINLSTENGMSQFSDAEHYKFDSEVITGDSQMYLADNGIIAMITELADGEIDFFMDMSAQYPDAALYEGQGLQLNATGFAEQARWQSCPDIVGLYVRDEYDNMIGNGEDAKEQRRRAQIVFRNIAEGNIVNPAE